MLLTQFLPFFGAVCSKNAVSPPACTVAAAASRGRVEVDLCRSPPPRRARLSRRRRPLIARLTGSAAEGTSGKEGKDDFDVDARVTDLVKFGSTFSISSAEKILPKPRSERRGERDGQQQPGGNSLSSPSSCLAAVVFLPPSLPLDHSLDRVHSAESTLSCKAGRQ